MTRRGWLLELTDFMSLREVSLETGIDTQRLKDYVFKKAILKSGTEDYETIRNANGRIAYRHLRSLGLKPKEADRHRRTYLDPNRRPKEEERHLITKRQPGGEILYQLWIVGNYQNVETGEVRYRIHSFSRNYPKKNLPIQYKECIRDAQTQLGGSNWDLIDLFS